MTHGILESVTLTMPYVDSKGRNKYYAEFRDCRKFERNKTNERFAQFNSTTVITTINHKYLSMFWLLFVSGDKTARTLASIIKKTERVMPRERS